MSSWRSRSWISGPLVTGQTRISSSLASIESLQYQVDKRGGGHRADIEREKTRIGKPRAFYRVLRRHQDRLRVGEGEVGADECVVILERVRDRLDAQARNQIEEALRVRGAGHGVHRTAAQRRRVESQ